MSKPPNKGTQNPSEKSRQHLSRAQCVARAAECRRMAKTADRPEHQNLLEHMAEIWTLIAADLRRRLSQ